MMVRHYFALTEIDPDLGTKNHLIRIITEDIEKGNDDRALRLISKIDVDRETVNLRGPYQSQLIHIASRHGKDVILKKLIEKGAEIQSIDYSGFRRTPLHWASEKGHLKCVEILVEAGADINFEGQPWSILVNQVKCGENIDVTSTYPQSPLKLAKNDFIKLAMEKPEWNTLNHYRFPPLFKEVVKYLLCLVEVRKGEECKGFRQLKKDECFEIIKKIAYPLSNWFIDSIIV